MPWSASRCRRPPTPTSPPTCGWPCASCGRDHAPSPSTSPSAASRARCSRHRVRTTQRPTAPTRPPPASSTPAGSDDDRLVEAALRPKRLSEFPGQPRVRDQLGLVLEAAKRRGSAPDHVLLSGPPGLGKTTLAMIVAAEIEKPIRVTSGPAIQHAGDLAAVLSSLDEGEVLFLDEIHRMSRSAEEMLYLAMEDFRVDVIVGKGPGATAIPLELPPFTVVGATTRAGLLPAPLRDRFGFTGHLDYYDTADLDHDPAPLGAAARGRGRRGRHRRDRQPLPRHAPHRQPAAAPGARLGPGARRGPRRPRGRRTRRWRCSTSTTPGSTGSTGPCSRRSAAGSGAGRSGCRPSRWPWARSPTPSRPSPSPTSCARATSCAPPGAGRPPHGPGGTSGSRRRPASCQQEALPLDGGPDDRRGPRAVLRLRNGHDAPASPVGG